MEANKKRRCIICGKEYSYCPKCRKDKDKPVWMFTFDSQNCHDIYQVLIDEQYGHITEAEAKAALQKLDLSSKKDFDENTRILIDKILSYSGEKAVEAPKEEVESSSITSLFGKK
jgi:hypothetical protein